MKMLVLVYTISVECGDFEVSALFVHRVNLRQNARGLSLLWKKLAVKRLLSSNCRNSNIKRCVPSQPRFNQRLRFIELKKNWYHGRNLRRPSFKPVKKVRKRADGTHVPQNATTVNGVDNEESPQPQDINHNDDLRKPDVERVCPSWSPQQVSVWLKGNRYSTHVHTLASYSGADILRLSKENLTQLCGLADGIRLYNALHSRSVIPHLTVYVCVESRDCIYQAVYLNHLSSIELMKKVSTIVGLSPAQVVGFYIQGPNGIKVLLSDELVSHLPDHSAYVIDVIQGGSDKYQFLLKMSEHSPT